MNLMGGIDFKAKKMSGASGAELNIVFLYVCFIHLLCNCIKSFPC